ncbi:hypothetical protein CP975_33215 [Streptomyces alboniger]|uniref:Uncharacterized protein n=1 Tax=Streptomyces alboniger TaxID=132473 RepID=A0A5J6HTJ0_STRAD|nr:hypothetical protein CP975_33215 [Streptomyces alboniger]
MSEAPPKSRAMARNGSVTTVAMAPPIERRTSAMAFSMCGPPRNLVVRVVRRAIAACCSVRCSYRLP